MYPQSMFRAKIRKISDFFLLKIFIFDNFKNLCILHGHVFVTNYEHAPVECILKPQLQKLKKV